MRVLQVIPTLEAGGAEGFVTNLSVGLSTLATRVRLFLMAGVRGERGQLLLARLRDAGVVVVGVEQRNVRSPANILRLASLIRSWRPHIVGANMYPAEILTVATRGLTVGSGTRYVRRLAGTNICSYRSPCLIRSMDRFFGVTIACSPAVSEAYRRFMGPKYRTEIVTIPNGGLLQKAATTADERQQARIELGISSEAFVVVHIGRMLGGAEGAGLESEPKAQDVLLKAFAQAFRGDRHSVLLLVGDGPLRPELELLARNYGIAAQTRFLGQQAEPWPALKAANVFCFPSRYEGLPNVLPEAASCGLPVVASDIREIRDISVSDCWLLKPRDNVEAFANGMRTVRKNLDQFSLRARNAAPAFREKYSMTTCAQRYLQAYQTAFGDLRKTLPVP